MSVLLSIVTGDTNGNSIGNNGGYFGQGQSFLTGTGWIVNQLDVVLKRGAGTDNVPVLVRIETDSSNKPSGTLADANASASIPSFTSTSYATYTVNFTQFSLSNSTKYWVVLKTAQTEGASQYYRDRGHSTNIYANGQTSTLTGASSWDVAVDPDLDVILYTPTAAVTDTNLIGAEI